MPSGKKRKRHKVATHKRKKRRRANRHKKNSVRQNTQKIYQTFIEMQHLKLIAATGKS
jgi:hypothetical protein